MSKKTLLLTLFLFITAAFSPVAAQGNSGADTVYTFRFLPQKDMFYVPMYDNENELARLLDCIDRLMPGITDGTVPVYVDGYCSSMGSEKENLATAAIRSNRVKSELIIRRNLTEDCFVTANHPTDGDYVVVRVKAPTNLPHEGEAKDVKVSDDTDVKVSDDTVGKVSDDTAGKASDNSQTESEGLSLPHRGRLEGASPSTSTCCAGPRLRPTSASSGASARRGAYWSTAHGHHGAGTTKTAAMLCGRLCPRCAII